MKIYAINGGPRKKWNTGCMLESFLHGAKDAGALVEMIHLYDLKYAGCRECYGCKLKNNKNYGKCIFPDDLKGVLEKVYEADGIVMGSPIYFGEMTAQLRSFLERYFFAFDSHEIGESSLVPHKVYNAMIYTMNVTKENMLKSQYPRNLETMHNYLQYVLKEKPNIIYAYNTYEFNDYSKYEANYWNERDKFRWRKEQFPKDLQMAYDAGRNMVMKIRKDDIRYENSI